MIRVNQIKLTPGHTDEELEYKIRKVLRLRESEKISWEIIKSSVDARKKPDIFIIYTADVHLVTHPDMEQQIIRGCRSSQVSAAMPVSYEFKASGKECLLERPVIIGTGPAGLFCGYMLALHGYRPLLLERGQDVEKRIKEVGAFWQSGKLDTECNVQFGEGGAGTFSDGKLNTLVKDKYGRNKAVLDIFVEAGAPAAIRYEGKPHIGTDILSKVIKHMRETIIREGGEVRFGVKVIELGIVNDSIQSVTVEDTKGGGRQKLMADTVVLAIGHSARDTFEMLFRNQIPMEAKPFAVGMRVEHPQELINFSQYGQKNPKNLPQATYKLTARTSEGRSVYSFCMCPGGYVVNASSEEGRLAVNGMSYSRRDGLNANSAIVVSVSPADYGDGHPLSGLAFQRTLEETAYRVGQGKVPVESYGEFKRYAGMAAGAANIKNQGAGSAAAVPVKDWKGYIPQIKGQWKFSPVHEIMPEVLNRAFLEGMEQFGHMIKGFDADQVLLSGIESRTSSPVRILRDESGQSRIRGLYPCGEGAGYAGGITSAAMDGIKTAELIAGRYRPFTEKERRASLYGEKGTDDKGTDKFEEGRI